MPDNNTVERAEQRVREMDRLTRQFSEQGNRYMQKMMNRRNQSRMQGMQYTDGTYNDVPESRSNVHNIPQVGKNGTRFEPVERKRNITPKAAEEPKNEEKNVRQNDTQNAGAGGRQHTSHGFDGEKLLLAALMYLLIMENADIKLILAIAYLIL